jgi:C4-dicarboxylate-specific signal transduction histidine kinase
VLVTIMDVTARKRAEEALQRAQGELARASTLTTMGELAGSIAHELRQPLAAIAMNGSATLRWLNRESPDVAEATAAAARIVREAQRADEVIRSLRALLEKSELQRAPLDVNGAIHEVLGLVRGELRRNDVSIQTVLGAGLPPALGDRVQLQQVVLNLVMNGIEAMSGVADRPRTLAIRTERAGAEGVAVVVEDAGPGLDPATAERIFDPFFTTKPNGLGMGLSICRSIVEAHGGELSASPRSPHGTTFRFTVPTVAEAAVPSLPSAVAEQRASGFAG